MGGFCGPSGCGKTTLVKLLLKFYEPEKGNISVGGHDLRFVDATALRTRIGYVPQDIYIFAGTVGENIALGNPGAPMDAIIEAAQKAGAHDFISALPHQYATKLSEHGSTLSGGERQRLALARALIENRGIVILDEATSNLDTVSGRSIHQTIEKLRGEVTAILIAHRLTTIKIRDGQRYNSGTWNPRGTFVHEWVVQKTLGGDSRIMRFSNIEDFHLGYQFFMNRPSHVIRNFVVTVAVLLIGVFIWVNIAQMDDIVHASALLRPAQTISSVRSLSGGQVQIKNYSQNDLVREGDLLLQLDTSADTLELRNSLKLLAHINNNIMIQATLLETIRTGINTAVNDNEEAYIHSQQFLLENRYRLLEVEERRVRLQNERNLHPFAIVREHIAGMERDLERSELQFDLWKNSMIVEATNTISSLTHQRVNLERRISDLEQSIRNATIYSPISGRVNELRRLNIGDNIVPGEEILLIIPDGEAGLIVELYIDPAHIARVRPGQTAVLRFPSLPPSRYGKLETVITLIPADFSVVQAAVPVFIVEAALDEPWLLSRRGEKVYLRAGIGAEARIIIDRDTVLRMFLRKFDFLN